MPYDSLERNKHSLLNWVCSTDKHRFAVIFGSGQNKFRTDIVEDLFDNPTFNTECEM